MNKFTVFFIVLLFCSLIVTANAVAQNSEWIVGMRLGMSIATGGQGTAQFNPQTLRVENQAVQASECNLDQRGKLFSINNTPLLKSSILIRNPELRLNGEVFLNITSIFPNRK